jgi:TRAP transporter TAXI family solute receptor
MLAVLYDNYTQIVTTEAAGIRSVADLRGKVVATGAPGSGAETLALRMLTVAGLDPDRDVRRQALSVAQSVDALRDGKIAAFVWTGGLPTGALMDLAASPSTRMRLIPCADLVEPLNRRYGDVYRTSVIPRGTYPGMDADVPVFVVSSVLVVDASMSDDLAWEITRALFDHRDELVAVHREARNLSLETASRGSPIPFHPGAIRYYREQNVWID